MVLKRKKIFGLLFILSLIFISCDSDKKNIKEFNELKPPVILTAKYIILYEYDITLKDGNNTYHMYRGNLANQIGNSYNIGDTIK